MGKGNRQKRTAKESARRKPPSPDVIAQHLHSVARQRWAGYRQAASDNAADLAGTYRDYPSSLGQAADIALRQVIGNRWLEGWLPVDLWQVIRRRGDVDAACLVVDAIAAEVAQYPVASIDQRFNEQLREIEAECWWERDEPHLGQWARHRGIPIAQAVTVVITVTAELMALPELSRILPPPGTANADENSAAAGVDQKVLTRVRGLLAKAESTAYPEEAEALSAKAQELMNRHAFERALIDASEHKSQRASSCRIWLDNPYVDAKGRLVAAIATANRCRAVHYTKIGFMALVGDELDLEITELLSTSLLVQATTAMLAKGSQTTRGGTSRTRSFRQSFLVAYAGRIGERLEEAEHAAHDPVEDQDLLPVLADRSQVVDDTFNEMFPDLVYKSVSVSNGAGWYAGRAAADSANLSLDRTAVNA